MSQQQITRPEILQILNGKARFLKVWEQTAAGRRGEYQETHAAVYETEEQLAQAPEHAGEQVFELVSLKPASV